MLVKKENKENDGKICSESFSHLTRLRGKIIRDEKCPFNKSILCEECEDYDGWCVDTKEFLVYVYCANQELYDANRLDVTLKEEKSKKKKIRIVRKK